MAGRDFLPIEGWSLTSGASDLRLGQTCLALQTVTVRLPNYAVCLSGSPVPGTTDVSLKMTYRSASELRVLPAATALRSSSQSPYLHNMRNPLKNVLFEMCSVRVSIRLSWGISWFLSIHPRKCCDSISARSRLPLYTFFIIHDSSIFA